MAQHPCTHHLCDACCDTWHLRHLRHRTPCRHPFCKRLGMPFDPTDPKGKCKTATGKMPWSFYAANADQGLLYHYCGPSK